MDTLVTVKIGGQYKDFWAERYRSGDIEAGINLARCYEACGEFLEGLVVIDEVLARPLEPELESKALLRKAVLQKDSPLTAWTTIQKASLEVSPQLRGNLHNQRGRILKELKKYDRAILEYTSAGVYWEGDPHLVGHSYNNLAGVYLKIKRYEDAHEFVDKALALWGSYEYLPCAMDQKAQIFIAQKKYLPAFELAESSLWLTSDRHRWRVESLNTLAQVLAGLGRNNESLIAVEKSLEICEYLGDQNLRVQVLLAQKRACEIMYEVSDALAIQLALELSDGNLRSAARKLGINHSALHKAIATRGLTIKIKHARNFSVVRKGTEGLLSASPKKR